MTETSAVPSLPAEVMQVIESEAVVSTAHLAPPMVTVDLEEVQKPLPEMVMD